jgi:hypothetical protein
MEANYDDTAILGEVKQFNEAFEKLREEVGKVIVGQKQVVEELLIALFSGGHCLLVGVPGLAKTLLISTVAGAMDLQFSRIQFTPDLMPSDITGTEILEEEAGTGKRLFKFVRGPIFANIVLAFTWSFRFSCSPHKTRSSRRARTLCPRPSSTASCSISMSTIPAKRKSAR